MVVFAHASEDLEFGKKIKEFYALGPVTTVGKCIGAARIFGKVYMQLNHIKGRQYGNSYKH